MYLTSKYLKTYGLLCLRKRIKRVYTGINAAVIGLERFSEQMKTLCSHIAWYPFHGSQLSIFKGFFLQLNHACGTQSMIKRVSGDVFQYVSVLVPWYSGATFQTLY